MVTPEHHVALVEHLVESSEPIRRIWPVRIRMTVLLVMWSTLGILVASTWPRPDLVERVRDPIFAIGVITLAIATGFTTLMALRCAVPGRAPTPFEGLTALLLIGGAALALASESVVVPSNADGWLCSLRTIAVAALPWATLIIAIRRGAPVRVVSAAVYAGIASLLFATTVLRMACPADGSSHWLAWHLGIVPLVTLLTTPLAARWLRTWRHA
jgi:hypothetical protein